MTLQKMKPAVKQRWVKALRSGEYKQARGRLHGGVGFCCLGVLCDVEYDGYWEWRFGGGRWAIGGEASYPPAGASRAWGLSLGAQRLLSDMNDEYGMRFAEIADWIEENL